MLPLRDSALMVDDERESFGPPPPRRSAPVLDPDLGIGEAEFPLALRGYDRAAVDGYVARLLSVIADLRADSSPREAVQRALEEVGEETSEILQRAHRAADELTARSRAQADERLDAAERDSTAMVKEAEGRVRELDLDIDALWQERLRLIADVRRISRELEKVASTADERLPPNAPEAEGPAAVEADTDEHEALAAVDVETDEHDALAVDEPVAGVGGAGEAPHEAPSAVAPVAPGDEDPAGYTHASAPALAPVGGGTAEELVAEPAAAPRAEPGEPHDGAASAEQPTAEHPALGPPRVGARAMGAEQPTVEASALLSADDPADPPEFRFERAEQPRA